jgi:hypothetical protein
MAGSRTGVPTVIRLVRRVCHIVRTYGAAGLEAATTPEFKAAVDALMLACAAFEALDDYPAEIDATLPEGPEDQIGA